MAVAAGVLALSACADHAAAQDAAKPAGRLIFLEDGARVFTRAPGRDVRSATGDACIEVQFRERMRRTEMEWLQNADVSFAKFSQATPAGHCTRAIAVTAKSRVERLSKPYPFERESHDDDLPEAQVPHLDDIRGIARWLIATIVAHDYDAFNAVMQQEEQLDEWSRRRFNFFVEHARDFFGAGLDPSAQFLVRYYQGRRTATVCVCRAGNSCTRRDTFDAPTLQSWGDAMFCFRVANDSLGGSEEYVREAWKVVDPVFR